MDFEKELQFLKMILENMHLNVSILETPYKDASLHDFGIRKLVYPDIDYANYLKTFCESCKEQIIYKAWDEFLFHYLILKLPDTQGACLLIGPYTLTSFNDQLLLNLAQEFHLSPEVYPSFQSCYSKVPLLMDSSALFTLVNSFAAILWGSMEAFSIVELENVKPADALPMSNTAFDPAEQFHNLEQIERRFHSESEFLQIVSHGQLHKIEMYLNLIDIQDTEVRMADRVRNAKNYAIIMNTLLRKAAENGSVHPVHIDRVSSAFAKKIELQTSEKGVTALIKEMARKYTLLVKNHSLQGYSALVRKVLVYIDGNLSGDLTLAAQAKQLHVNPSYLSTVFKKETGHTLTDYVTGKRMEHAVFLLNSTAMQIQTVAQYCGIPDVCYFTKVFKKFIGKTPTEYKNSIRL